MLSVKRSHKRHESYHCSFLKSTYTNILLHQKYFVNMSDILETQLLIDLAFYVLCFLLTLYVPLVDALVLCRYSSHSPKTYMLG